MANLLALVVGCDYVDTGRPVPVLRGAENDAKSLARLLAGASFGADRLGRMTLLLGTEATTAKVRAAVQETRAAQRVGDSILCYFSGHGSQGDDGLVLYTFDDQYHARRLLEDCGTDAASIAFVIDSCHAGAIVDSEQQLRMNHFTLKQGGIQFLCSATATEQAQELDGHGLFTQKLIEVLMDTQVPSRLALPLDLNGWCDALQGEFLDKLGRASTPREVLGPDAPEASPQSQHYLVGS